MRLTSGVFFSWRRFPGILFHPPITVLQEGWLLEDSEPRDADVLPLCLVFFKARNSMERADLVTFEGRGWGLKECPCFCSCFLCTPAARVPKVYVSMPVHDDKIDSISKLGYLSFLLNATNSSTSIFAPHKISLTDCS